VSRARDRDEVVHSLEALLPGVRAKGNGMVLGAAAEDPEDGRTVPFMLAPVRLGQRRGIAMRGRQLP
jgi:hypothetical protein